MEEVRQKILDFLNEKKGYCAVNLLKKKLNIKGEEQTTGFICAIEALIEDGSLFFDPDKGVRIFTNDLGYLYGVLHFQAKKGYFVVSRDQYKIFIDEDKLGGALEGDSVIVANIRLGKKRYYGDVFQILKRGDGKIIFEVVESGGVKTLRAIHPFERISGYISKGKLKNLVAGELILGEVGKENKDGGFLVDYVKTIGHKDDPDITLKVLASKYDVLLEFSSEALLEAQLLPTEVMENEIIGRVDLRGLDIVTIDCDRTKDRDDAVYVSKLDNGNYKLYTSISAVSHYIKKGSKLYQEALLRCCSHYPKNACIPLFPHSVSNGICSLNEGVDRLTRTCEMEINLDGEVVDYKIYDSVIHSRKAMRYSDVNRVLEGETVEGYQEFSDSLKLMSELSDILEEAKQKRDYLDFDIPDTLIVEDSAGKVVDVLNQEAGRAEKLIENFMVVTNMVIAKHYSWLPFIYRVHESPDEKIVRDTIELLNVSGFHLPKPVNINERTIKGILEEIKSVDEAKIVRSLLLRSQKRARYDIYNLGHFALQLNDYCHFTSPIRRITDFMIHSVIDLIESDNYQDIDFNQLESDLEKVSMDANKMEIVDKKLENEARNMAISSYMASQLGKEFKAYVSEVLEKGIVIRTPNMITGYVKKEDILDDHYYFDKKKKALIGKSHGSKYQIGDRVDAVVKEVALEKGEIYFSVVKEKVKTLKKWI